MKLFAFVLGILGLQSICFAQSLRDTLHVQEVTVGAYRTQRLIPKIIQIDSAVIQHNSYLNLSELLQQQTGLNFKDYGVGGSVTVGFRGANATQTKICWNGLPVNSPMLGLLDFSIIPVSALNKISLEYGGASAHYGSGAVGGVVNLENVPDFSQPFKVELNQQIASFGRTVSSLHFTKSTKRWESQTVLNRTFAKNNFSYINRVEFGRPKQRMQHAEVLQYGALQSVFYRPSSTKTFAVHSWYQWSDRHIAPPMFNQNVRSLQKDWSWRNVFAYEADLGKNWDLKSRLGYIREHIHFVNGQVSNDQIYKLLDTKSHFDYIDHRLELGKRITRGIYSNLGYELIYEGAEVEDYQGYRTRKRLSLFASSSVYTSKWYKSSVAVRKEFSATQTIPLVLSLTGDLNLTKSGSLKLKGGLSRNYTIPTLNDLYWIPGGNRNLKVEYGWNKDLGLSSAVQMNDFISSELKLNAYHTIINDFILWQPSVVESGNWSPENLRKVRMQGLELEGTVKVDIPYVLLKLNVFYAYTEALNLKGITANDQSVGKQLIYVPFEKWGVNSIITYYRYDFGYLISVNGFRYTSSDNTTYLPGYVLHQVSFGRSFIIRKQELNIRLKIDNLFNESYESVPFRPQPGRSCSVNLIMNLD